MLAETPGALWAAGAVRLADHVLPEHLENTGGLGLASSMGLFQGKIGKQDVWHEESNDLSPMYDERHSGSRISTVKVSLLLNLRIALTRKLNGYCKIKPF